MNELSTTILQEAADCFKVARENLIVGAALLWKIGTENLWQEKYSSFSEYVQEECQISPSFAAKLIKVHQNFHLSGGIPQEQLKGIDVEKLYLAARLDMPVEQQLVRAKTLSRSDLKAELAEKDGHDCLHESTIQICTKCHQRV